MRALYEGIIATNSPSLNFTTLSESALKDIAETAENKYVTGANFEKLIVGKINSAQFIEDEAGQRVKVQVEIFPNAVAPDDSVPLYLNPALRITKQKFENGIMKIVNCDLVTVAFCHSPGDTAQTEAVKLNTGTLGVSPCLMEGK